MKNKNKTKQPVDPAIAYHGIIILMKQIQKWQKQSESIDPEKGGYSDMRLWPAYMITSILILTLSPLIGSFLAFGIVLTPALLIAVRAAKLENKNPESIARYQARMEAIYNNPVEAPEVAIVSVAKPAELKEDKSSTPENAPRLVPSFSN